MELRIEHPGDNLDLALVVERLAVADPSSVVDRESASGALRIATVLAPAELCAALAAAGLRVREADLVYLPSVCCGGCGG